MGVTVFTRPGISLLFESQHCAPLCLSLQGLAVPLDPEVSGHSPHPPPHQLYPISELASSLSHEPCSVQLRQRNEGLCGERNARLRIGTPAEVLVLPPNLLGSIWMKTSIQLPLILKFCDSLKCTLGMTASVSIKLQF